MARKERSRSKHVRRKDLAGAQVAVAAEVEVLELAGDVFQFRDGLEDLYALGGHFRTGAVAADDGDAEDVVAAHVGFSFQRCGGQPREQSLAAADARSDLPNHTVPAVKQ